VTPPTATTTGSRSGAAGADPRIAERRRRVEIDRRRQRRRRVLAMLVVVSVVGAVWGIVHSPLLDTESVAVTGVTDAAQAESVVAASGVRRGDALVLVDGGEVVRRVSALPWVASAGVSRSLVGGTLEVAVVPRTPVAAVPTPDGAWLLVDRSGHVVAGTSDPAGLVALTGVSAGPPGERLAPVDQALVEVAGSLSPGLVSRVASVGPGPGGEAELRLVGGGVVVLGQPGDLAPDEVGVKLRTVRTVLATVDLECVARIDVRVSDTAVLTRNPTCT